MNKVSPFWLLLTLVALRIALGVHFFAEGTGKLQTGNFQSSGFLSAARGPFASYFQVLLDDPNGEQRLCVVREALGDKSSFRVDSTLTLAIWDDFVDRASSHYRFGDPELHARIKSRIEQLERPPVDTASTSQQPTGLPARADLVQSDREALSILPQQKQSAKQCLRAHQQELDEWLVDHQTELIAHFSTAERLNGFQRDGASAGRVAIEVESLRGQVDQIRMERNTNLARWSREVLAIWDSLESQINNLAVDEQRSKSTVQIHRPFDQPNSKLKWVNRIIPWFLTIVGALLVVGLLTRFASIAASLFLVSVILNQPFWIPGSTPTYYQLVEMFALFVLAAAAAGRFAGLDYFLSRRKKMHSNLA